MPKKHKPRSGSLAFYPKKRAKREIPSFKNVKNKGDEVKPQNFLGYKVGMTHITGKNAHEKSRTFGQEIVVPVTILETPNLKVFGIRAYEKIVGGINPIGDVYNDKFSKHLLKRIKNFKKKTSKRKSDSKKNNKKTEEKKKTVSDLEKELENIYEIRLLVHTQPDLTTMGKKKPEVSEIFLNGTVEEQLKYAKEKLGKEISITDVFTEKEFADVKGVTIGKGFTGPVKRAGIKTHRPKAKTTRTVGSIGPWHPATVMWTVARPGQLGYQTRTEYNKRIIKIGDNPDDINRKGGFLQYGLVRNQFIMLRGSVPGPKKRLIGLRHNIRKADIHKEMINKIEFIATKGEIK